MIPLMAFPAACSRRILNTVSNTNIPISPPDTCQADSLDHQDEGSFFDADHPATGVPFPRRSTVSIDQLAQVLIVGTLYVLHLTDACPSADETISSYVGRGQRRGERWALILAPAIDRIFVLLGEAPGHCQRNVETAFAGQAPTT